MSQSWSGISFSLQYQHSDIEIGNKKTESSTKGILPWCTTEFSKLALKEKSRISKGNNWIMFHKCILISNYCFQHGTERRYINQRIQAFFTRKNNSLSYQLFFCHLITVTICDTEFGMKFTPLRRTAAGFTQTGCFASMRIYPER